MRTKTIQTFVIALWVFLCPAGTFAKEFAPCAPRSQEAIELNQATGWDTCAGIPSQEEVGIPAYPESRVTSAAGGGFNLPRVTLLSTSPLEEVVEFYKKSLDATGWKWNETLSIFYQGDSVGDALAMKSPSIRISPATDAADGYFLVDKAFRGTVKTEIEIHYKPVQAAGPSPAGQK